MNGGGKFRIQGYVTRKYMPTSGKCAFLTVEYLNGRGKKTIQEMVAFDSTVIDAIANLGQGETVDVRGDLAREALKNKAREDVQVDGRASWTTRLHATAIEVLERKPAPTFDDASITTGKSAGWGGDDAAPKASIAADDWGSEDSKIPF